MLSAEIHPALLKNRFQLESCSRQVQQNKDPINSNFFIVIGSSEDYFPKVGFSDGIPAMGLVHFVLMSRATKHTF
jgi:predicted nucleic acid-binding Zn finger protein